MDSGSLKMCVGSLEERQKRIVDQRTESVGWSYAIVRAGWVCREAGIILRHDLVTRRSGQEVAVGRSRKRTERQMRAPACGVIHADRYSSRKKVLHAKVPLVDFRVARIGGAKAVVVREAPECE